MGIDYKKVLDYLEEIYIKIPSITGLTFLFLSGITRNSSKQSLLGLMNYDLEKVQAEGFFPIFIGASAYFIASSFKKTKYGLLIYHKAYDQSPAAIMITNREGKIEFVNQNFKEYFGMEPNDVIGNAIDIVTKEKVSTKISLLDAIKGIGVWKGQFEYKKDGKTCNYEIDIYPIEDKGKIIKYMCQIKDITKRVHSERQMREKASIDTLTGLLNRHSLFLEGEKLLSDMKGKGISLMYLDLDGFKNVNDKYDHNMGDLVLKEVSDRLNSSTRMDDLVARLGGDEFVVILRDSSIDETTEVAKRIIEKIEKPYFEIGKVLGTSIGISRTTDYTSLEDLLKSADSAMYKAKESTDIKYVFADHPIIPRREAASV